MQDLDLENCAFTNTGSRMWFGITGSASRVNIQQHRRTSEVSRLLTSI